MLTYVFCQRYEHGHACSQSAYIAVDIGTANHVISLVLEVLRELCCMRCCPRDVFAFGLFLLTRAICLNSHGGVCATPCDTGLWVHQLLMGGTRSMMVLLQQTIVAVLVVLPLVWNDWVSCKHLKMANLQQSGWLYKLKSSTMLKFDPCIEVQLSSVIIFSSFNCSMIKTAPHIPADPIKSAIAASHHFEVHHYS